SNNEAEAATVKIRNVTPAGFEIKIQEFAYQDQTHANETLTYMVIEKGVYLLPDGKMMVAGSTNLSNSSLETVRFGVGMSSTPIVFSSIVTDNDSTAVVTRTKNITSTDFQIKLKEAEIENQNHASETVHYLAVEAGTVTTSAYELSLDTLSSVRHSPVSIDPADYTMFIAGQQTENGGDTAWVRRSGDINVFIEEEKSKDNEVNHTNEAVGYLLIKEVIPPAAMQSSTFASSEAPQGTEGETSAEESTSEEPFLFELFVYPLEAGESLGTLRSDDELILPTTSDYAEVNLRDGSVLIVYIEDIAGETEVLAEDVLRMYYEVKTENWFLDFKDDLTLLGYDIVSANILNDSEIIFVDYEE
ncbi:MAG: hypothetical protein NE327_09085, partial [Lentisphaeraceae bacterium]|nr:hypothetical protein [Lentisphaeraceae bacterium]